MVPVRKKLADLPVYFEPGTCRRMMCLIGHDFVDSRNFIEAPHHRQDACDGDLSGKVAGSGVDGGEFYSRPNKVELFYRLPQKLVTVNENKSLIVCPTQAGLESVAEDDGLAASGGHGDQGGSVAILPVSKNSFFRFSLKGIKNHSVMGFRCACIFVGCGGSRVPLPNRTHS